MSSVVIALVDIEELLKHSRVKMRLKPVGYNPYVFKHSDPGLHDFRVTLERGEEVLEAYCSLPEEDPTLADVVAYFAQIAANTIPLGLEQFCKAYGLDPKEWNSRWCYDRAKSWTSKLHKVLGDERFDRAIIRPGKREEAKREKRNSARRVKLDLF